MRSFDFYDTLVTRMVANPTDIFALVGERLSIPDFSSMRVRAEMDARAALGGEVTFQQIYDHVPLPSGLKQKAQSLELELEQSLLVSVKAVCSQVRSGDLIISDMYHDEQHFRDVLQRLLPDVVPSAVLVSGAVGMNKASGALWRRVAADFPEHESHIGDNLLADVSGARRNGLVAEHFSAAILNRYEKAMAESGGDGSLLAGASRAARVSLTEGHTSPSDSAIIEVFASVFSPLLYAYVDWIMRTCAENNIHDVYFLARDGQLPFRMCSRLVEESGQDLQCHYIFASRQALHIPSCTRIDEAESWLLDDTPVLSLRIVAERAEVPLEVVVSAAQPYLSTTPDENIVHSERQHLRAVIRDPSFVAAFMQSGEHGFQAASAYYLAQGFVAGRRAAIVDVGWNGRLQRSLGNLLEKSGHAPAHLLGLYLCLSKRVSDGPGNELRGFIADPERPKAVMFFDRYRHVLEAVLSADHPTTLSFEFFDGVARPVLGGMYSEAMQQRIALQHATVDIFTDNMIALTRAAARRIAPPHESVMKNLISFLSRPSTRDGLAFEGFSFVDGQTGTEAKPICKSISFSDLLKRRRDLGYWPEGTLSASGLSVAASVRRTLQRLRGTHPPS